MSPAFDEFEQQLVKASRELTEARRVTVAPAAQAERRSFRQRLRSLSVPTKLGVAVAAVCTLSGAAFAATQLDTGPGIRNINAQFDNTTMPTLADCSYAAADIKAVRHVLDSDGLHNWRIVVVSLHNPDDMPGPRYTHGCYETEPIPMASKQEVELVQQAPLPAALERSTKREEQSEVSRTDHIAQNVLDKVTAHVNETLDARCLPVSQAERVWTGAASAAGFKLAGPSVFHYITRQMDRGRPGNFYLKRSVFYTYTLKLQPATQRTGKCAHVLVEPEAPFHVYIARIKP